MKAFHFVGKTLRDGRPVPPDGEWLAHNRPVKMCSSGLHASIDPRDALQYAPGETLCYVECDDIEGRDDDKLVCRRRQIIARIDATALLWEMARWSAAQVLHHWDAPQVVRDYLASGDESLRDAASVAASVAASAAASAAARDAARDAARAAASAAASAAARDAARAAARAAARDAARDAASTAARAAARDAAWDAAWAAQRKHFNALVCRAFAAIGITIEEQTQ